MVVSLAGMVAGMVVVSAAYTGSDPALRNGPLVIRGGTSVVGFEVPVGQRVAYGFNVMRNTGLRPISNLAATLVPEREGATTDVTFEPVQIVPVGEAGIFYLLPGSVPNPTRVVLLPT